MAQSIALRSRTFPQSTLLAGALGVGLCRARGGILAAWVTCGALRICCPAAFPCPCARHRYTWRFSSSLTTSLCSVSFDIVAYLFRVSICSKLLSNMIMTWKQSSWGWEVSWIYLRVHPRAPLDTGMPLVILFNPECHIQFCSWERTSKAAFGISKEVHTYDIFQIYIQLSWLFFFSLI